MKTVFKVGMEVWDKTISPNKGKVIEVLEDTNFDFPIKVEFDDGLKIQYTNKGCFVKSKGAINTLSTVDYSIELEGFEQKAPTPTYEEAEEWMKKEYAKGSLCLMMRDVFEALEALRKLIVLRDYYNEGWQPDWSKKNSMHFCIRVRNNKITIDSNSDINEFNTVLVFRDYTIRDKFLEEQRELLEIAKPLL